MLRNWNYLQNPIKTFIFITFPRIQLRLLFINRFLRYISSMTSCIAVWLHLLNARWTTQEFLKLYIFEFCFFCCLFDNLMMCFYLCSQGFSLYYSTIIPKNTILFCYSIIPKILTHILPINQKSFHIYNRNHKSSYMSKIFQNRQSPNFVTRKLCWWSIYSLQVLVTSSFILNNQMFSKICFIKIYWEKWNSEKELWSYKRNKIFFMPIRNNYHKWFIFFFCVSISSSKNE